MPLKTPRVRLSAARKSPRKLVVGLILLAVALLAGGYGARSALQSQGKWHEVARSLYHEVKGNSAQAAVLPTERADAALIVYDDKLGEGWQDWSWGTRDFSHTDPVHAGKAAILLTPSGNRGLYLHHDGFETGGYGTLQAFVQGDTATRVCLAGEDLNSCRMCRQLNICGPIRVAASAGICYGFLWPIWAFPGAA